MTPRVLVRCLFVVFLIAGGLAATAAQASQEATPGATPIAPIPEAVAQPGGDLPGDPQIQLVQVADGFVDPVNVTIAPDGRIFVVERLGRIRVVQDGQLLEEPLLDISDSVLSAFLEQGLYSMALHPDFAENGRFYVHFASLLRNGDSMIVEYTISPDNPNMADPESARALLQIDQPYANHNGGEIAFGPDGYLYIGMGDGGWEGDPLEAGQNLGTMLGKMLRIDVNVGDGIAYRIPQGNPFAENVQLVELFGIDEATFAEIHPEAEPAIWDYGLRNPYEFSFDPATGDLYIADVGQNHWEEINFAPAGYGGGVNWGWDFLMGSHCFPVDAESCPLVGRLPAAEYSHEVGCAVIGFGVDRAGTSLDGIYFAGDYCSGRIWGLARDEAGSWQFEELLDTALQWTGAGQHPDGSLYATNCYCNYGGPDPQQNPPGALWQLVPAGQVPEGATTAPLATPEATPEATPATPADQAVQAQDEITIEMVDIDFNPAEVTVPANTDVTIHLPNNGSILHNFSITEKNNPELPFPAIDVDVQPGESETITLNAPPGDYYFFCDIPGHEAAGMYGTLRVVEQGS